MRPRYALLALVLAAASPAFAQFTTRTAEPLLVPADKVQDATSKIVRIQHLRTGKVWTPDGVATPRSAQTVAFDNLSNPCGDPNGNLNFSFSQADGTRLCQCPIDPNAIFFTSVFPLGADPCGDPNKTPTFVVNFPSAGIVDPTDILWDNYSMDQSVAGDPNTLKDLRRIDFTFFNLQGVFGPPPGANYQLQVLLAPFEFFDYDSSGTFDQTDGGIVVTFAFDGNNPGGLFTSTIDLDATFGPNTPLLAYGDGLMLYDFANVFAADGGGFLPACGVGNAFAGGIPADANCAAPQDWVTTGAVDNLAGDFWLFANDTQGVSPGGPPFDPNFGIPDADGDPNTLSYTDILTNGLLVNVNFGVAFDQPMRLYVEADDCTVGPECEVPGGDADFDGDFDVDLSDLASLLANFGSGAAGHGDGDSDFDGDVDLTDLANVLSRFGASCPCP